MTREEIIRSIEHDNDRIMVYNRAMAGIIDILKKYAGKQYGPKTKERMRDELKAFCGCSWYIDNEYRFCIVPLNNEGYHDYHFKYGDFDVYLVQPNVKRIISSDNRICKDLEFTDFFLSGCHEYVQDPVAHADEIIASFGVLKEQYNKFESMINVFNSMLPSGIDRRHITGFKNYI